MDPEKRCSGPPSSVSPQAAEPAESLSLQITLAIFIARLLHGRDISLLISTLDLPCVHRAPTAQLMGEHVR